MKFFSASCTDVGKKRKLNEDSFLDRADLGLWAVADGMGGHDAGEVASSRIVEALEGLGKSPSLKDASISAGEALISINRELRDLAREGGVSRTIGSTVVALLVSGGRYSCLWAGDSRAYMVRGRHIAQITADHSLVGELVRSGLLSAEEAKAHPDSNVITRAVGAADNLQLDQVEGDALPEDYFILASDGVTRVMEDAELLDMVISRNPKQAVMAIRDVVLERGAPDNLTIIVIRMC